MYHTKYFCYYNSYQEIIHNLANLATTKDIGFDQSSWITLAEDLENKDAPKMMKKYVKQLTKLN